jgi:hypothetical protein
VHRVLGEHLAAFEEAHGGRLPAHVMAELRAALRCGVFEEGVACFACDGCGARTFVPLSCKRRGFCPGCCGRRMADIAAHLCERVLPKVAYRQWVLSVSVGVRYLALRHRRLARRVLGVVMRVILGWQRRKARGLGIEDGRGAGVAVTYFQRG